MSLFPVLFHYNLYKKCKHYQLRMFVKKTRLNHHHVINPIWTKFHKLRNPLQRETTTTGRLINDYAETDLKREFTTTGIYIKDDIGFVKHIIVKE